MNKRVQVATTDSRQFVKDIIELAKLGATLPDDAGVFKGIMIRTQLEVSDDVVIQQSPSVRVLPTSKKEKEEYIKEKAKEVVIPVTTQVPFQEEKIDDVQAEAEKPTRRGRKKVEDTSAEE